MVSSLSNGPIAWIGNLIMVFLIIDSFLMRKILLKIVLSLLFKPCNKSCARLLPVFAIFPAGLLSVPRLKFSSLSFNNSCDPELLLLLFVVVSTTPMKNKNGFKRTKIQVINKR